jgi:LacI family transcriptional regulator
MAGQRPFGKLRRSAMSTLKEIARAAGVHITTVAAVLNGVEGNTRVGSATRERVTEVAQRLGYVRNESARRLRTGKSNMVGFIGGDLRNPFFSELASALERELAAHKLQLMISHVSAAQGATFLQTVDILRQQTVSKIIYWDESAVPTPAAVNARMQLLPIGFTVEPRPGVWLDLKHAIFLAVTYLHQKGLRRIAFFAPQGREESPSVSIRQKMFFDECRRQKLPTPACLFYRGESWDLQASTAGARALLEEKTAIEAFIGFNDVAALGLLLASQGLSHQPRVVCFDGTPLARSWPGVLPYLDLRISELAKQATTVIVGGDNGSITGLKKNWLHPKLIS